MPRIDTRGTTQSYPHDVGSWGSMTQSNCPKAVVSQNKVINRGFWDHNNYSIHTSSHVIAHSSISLTRASVCLPQDHNLPAFVLQVIYTGSLIGDSQLISGFGVITNLYEIGAAVSYSCFGRGREDPTVVKEIAATALDS